MQETLLLKHGEVVLKGRNRYAFINRLKQNVVGALSPYGRFHYFDLQSTLYVRPEPGADMDGAYEAAKRIFGFASVNRAARCEKDMDSIIKTASEYLKDRLLSAKTFKVEAKRSDKAFPYNTPQIQQIVGGALGEQFPHLEVDVKNPDVMVVVEIRDEAAFVHPQPEKGAGGLPVGSNGRASVLLSGGIDSPVAAYMMAKRGLSLDLIHFYSYPYTSERALNKVVELAEILSGHIGCMRLNVVPFTRIQEEIRAKCREEYFTLIMRRFMMRISDLLAKKYGAGGLVTGESLGQVASQTMEALAVTGAVCTLPVFRPLIGLDKEEIVTTARKIGTFETSILPYEDCCTVFTPRSPSIKPKMDAVIETESRLDIDDLVAEAVEKTEIRIIDGAPSSRSPLAQDD